MISARNEIGTDTVKQSIRNVLDKHAELEANKPNESDDTKRRVKQKWFYS